MRTVLILAANPKGTPRLRLDEEVKRIEQGLERSKKRDQFKLVVKWATTDDDLRRALLDHQPEVVHFAGHGTGKGHGGTGRDQVPPEGVDSSGLAFEDEAGNLQLISGDALARLFELCADSVKCVVLNACYSEFQANAISQHIDFVIGMKKAIGDDAAIKFAVGFYDALGAGRDFEKAFRFGCSAIDLKGIPEHLTPVLKNRAISATSTTSSTEGFGGEAGAGERESSLSAAIVGMDDPGDHVRRRALERIESLLKRLKAEVLRDLAKELFDQDDSAFEEGTGPIVAHLTTPPKPMPDTIGALAEIHESLCKKSADWEQAVLVAEIIEEVTPLAIDDGLARRVRNDIHNRNSAFFVVPDHYSTTLEVLMACADGKPTKYRTPDVEAEDYEGKAFLRRAGKPKLPVEAPRTVESVAKSILVDLCEGQAVNDSASQSRTLKALVQRLLGVLNRYRHGENRGRTLYCFHTLPDDQREQTVHTEALTLIRKELDCLKPTDPDQLKKFPRFVFLLLQKESTLEELRSVIVTVLLTRFKHERTRTGHAASR